MRQQQGNTTYVTTGRGIKPSPALHLTTDLTIGISIKSRDSCEKVISPAVLGLLLGLVAVQGLLLGLVSVQGQLLGLVSVQGLLMGQVYIYVQEL